MLPKNREKMLKFCSKVKKVLKSAGNIKKVPKKCPAQSGHTYSWAQYRSFVSCFQKQ